MLAISIIDTNKLYINNSYDSNFTTTVINYYSKPEKYIILDFGAIEYYSLDK